MWVGAFNQVSAIVGSFTMIVKLQTLWRFVSSSSGGWMQIWYLITHFVAITSYSRRNPNTLPDCPRQGGDTRLSRGEHAGFGTIPMCMYSQSGFKWHQAQRVYFILPMSQLINTASMICRCDLFSVPDHKVRGHSQLTTTKKLVNGCGFVIRC